MSIMPLSCVSVCVSSVRTRECTRLCIMRLSSMSVTYTLCVSVCIVHVLYVNAYFPVVCMCVCVYSTTSLYMPTFLCVCVYSYVHLYNAYFPVVCMCVCVYSTRLYNASFLLSVCVSVCIVHVFIMPLSCCLYVCLCV